MKQVLEPNCQTIVGCHKVTPGNRRFRAFLSEVQTQTIGTWFGAGVYPSPRLDGQPGCLPDAYSRLTQAHAGCNIELFQSGYSQVKGRLLFG
jgi:hypothetical protein